MTINAGTSQVSFGVNHGTNPINKKKSYFNFVEGIKVFEYNSEVVKCN